MDGIAPCSVSSSGCQSGLGCMTDHSSILCCWAAAMEWLDVWAVLRWPHFILHEHHLTPVPCSRIIIWLSSGTIRGRCCHPPRPLLNKSGGLFGTPNASPWFFLNSVFARDHTVPLPSLPLSVRHCVPVIFLIHGISIRKSGGANLRFFWPSKNTLGIKIIDKNKVVDASPSVWRTR